MCFAHIGFASICLGIASMSAFQDEVEKVMNANDRLVIAEKELYFKGLKYSEGPNYYSRIGSFEVNTHDGYIKYLYPEIRMFYIEKQQTTEAAIYHNIAYDLYLTIGELEGEKIAVKAFYRPGISLLWFGGLLLFLGGIYGLLIKLFKQKINKA
jgi:cytochrome c-type biogenesis protein CcmF